MGYVCLVHDYNNEIGKDTVFKGGTALSVMLLKVANDDVASYKNSNEWLIHHPNESLLFKNLEDVWKELKVVYNGDFKNLVYGSLSNEVDILATLKRIKDRLSEIN